MQTFQKNEPRKSALIYLNGAISNLVIGTEFERYMYSPVTCSCDVKLQNVPIWGFLVEC